MLLFHSDKRLLVSDMSIHRTSARYEQPGQEQVKKIAEKVNVPHYAPPEAVISAVLENKNEGRLKSNSEICCCRSNQQGIIRAFFK